MRKRNSFIMAAGFLLTTYGCSSTMPPRDALVESARREFLVIAQEPYIQRYAPVPYTEARESMDETEKLWRKGASTEELEHHAYLTRKKVAIARETAGMNRAQEQVQQAETRRQDVLLEARETELEALRERAQSAEDQAAQAQQRSGLLSQELSELEAQQTERGIVITLSNILFDTNQSDLKPGADKALDKIAYALEEYEDHNLMIEGFTDSTGTLDHNEQLSQQRADAVKNALVQRGISPDRIQTRGYGERYPIATNNTPTGRQLNRRVEIIVSNDQSPVDERSS